jgi:hypothetical protein
VRLAYPDRTQKHGAVRSVEEPQAGQLVPQGVVVAYGCGVVPCVDAHAGVEPGGVGAPLRGGGVAAGGLVGEDEFEERRVREVLLLGEGEPLGQSVEHLAEFEPPQHLFEVW